MLILYNSSNKLINFNKNKKIKKLILFSEFIKFNLNTNLFIFFNKIYGLSYSISYLILTKFGLPLNLKLKNLTYECVFSLLYFFDFFFLDKDSTIYINSFFKALIFKFDNFKSFRIFKGLPVRGQRTASNAKSCRSILYHKKLISILDNFGLDFK